MKNFNQQLYSIVQLAQQLEHWRISKQGNIINNWKYVSEVRGGRGNYECFVFNDYLNLEGCHLNLLNAHKKLTPYHPHTLQ